ncbi:glyoxylase-like metal-dependent hydrolase (beta-lactamase superfamily II) [Flavobacterium sp. HSC-32F16]|uniref:MBL fold metallo-hydrolase n=1 Tax=Flavobacterium sp. HSC-32F16 TaxID=2910964 RepID=UPI0020A5AA7F|nr:MBL fold metallo-hydrolase [Flavobacterium sp. HSC-32F16]MCP2027533.1 glyoxylase-like metal-dependent hydrolase (beta-lactamase superfamily II) [Flavobacterium sp. HSC-32F16]
MKIIALQEGNYIADSKKEFKLITEKTNDPGLKMAIQPFVIITENDVILLDFGLGFVNDGIPFIHQMLKKNNIEPNLITKVLVSHLHKDHIEGIGYFENGNFIQNFPNAKIYIQKREIDFALEQVNNPSYVFEILNQLKKLSNVELMDNDSGTITDEIFYEVSAGHTKFHQVFWIKADDEIVFYGADDLPQKVYLSMHVAYKTDFDGKRAMESRKKWEQQAKDENWKVLLYHDMKTPVLEF